MKASHKRKYIKYLLSDTWAKIKVDLIEIHDGKCERCGDTKNLQVHHLTYENLFNEEPEDLLLLCSRCHMVEHGLIKKKRKKRVFKGKKKTIASCRKELISKFNVNNVKGCRGWRGLARKVALLSGEKYTPMTKSQAKAYVKRKLK